MRPSRLPKSRKMNKTDLLKSTLQRAVQIDMEGRYFEAQLLYEKSVEQLTEILESETSPRIKQTLYERVTEYLDRIQVIKNKLSASGVRVRHITIEEDSTGNSYKSLFESLLEKSMKEVLIEEPYLHEKYQCENLVTFLEMLVKNCPEMKYVQVTTKVDASKNSDGQRAMLEVIQNDLRQEGITCHIKYDPQLHDRKIVLGTYIIHMGRGLHIFKPRKSAIGLGTHDFDFRKCMKCEINIFKIKID